MEQALNLPSHSIHSWPILEPGSDSFHMESLKVQSYTVSMTLFMVCRQLISLTATKIQLLMHIEILIIFILTITVPEFTFILHFCY